MSLTWVFLSLAVSCFSTVYSQSYSNVTGLKTTLLTSYDASVIPLINQTDTMNVNATLYLLSILEIDQVKGSITYGVKLKYEWYDEVITWNPASYNGVSEMFLSVNDVWTPPIALWNPVSFTNLETSWMQVKYSSDGHAILTPINTLQSACSFYMKYWPFDMQKCELAFFPFGYSDQKVSITVTDKGIDTSLYNQNSEWNLLTDMLDYEVDTSSGKALVTFFIKVARQPSFYMLTVIMPINGIGMLTCLVFLLPSESGERVSYSITIMLALAVFLTVTAADLPKTSEPIPIMCIYILFGMMVCFGAVIMVILNLVIYYRDENVPIKSWYKTLVKISNFCSRCKPKTKVTSEPQSSDHVETKTSKDRRISKVVPFEKDPMPAGSRMGDIKEDDDEDNGGKITWQMVSQAIDKLLFYMLVILTYVPSIVILFVLAMTTDFGP